MIKLRLFYASVVAGLILASPLFASNGWADALERKVCTEILQGGLANRWSEDKLFYRGQDRKLKPLFSGDSVPHYIDQLFYFTHTAAGQQSAKSVLNWKFVYTTNSRPNRQTLVGLYNDRWTASNLARSSAACSNLSVEGYDNFHLHGTSNICLRFHFHQQDPDTLATSEVRRSFAFDEMVPRSNSDFLSVAGLFISPVRAAGATDNSTIRGTLVKSWIRNFSYEPDVTCVAVAPSFPDNARSLHLRIMNHGTHFMPEGHDWLITFSD